MALITRRQVLKGLAVSGIAGVTFGGYALAEPFRLTVNRYRVSPPGWPTGLTLRLAVLADLHIAEPWMSLERVRQIVARTNALDADAVLLLGDYVPSNRMKKISKLIAYDAWAGALAALKAPLGVHAVLGNHDWWDDDDVQRRRAGPTQAGDAIAAVGIRLFENDVVRLEKGGQAFWLAGLGDQWAFWPRAEQYDAFVRRGKVDYTGVDDLQGTLAKVTGDAPVILMAHEPDIFPEVPSRVALTISGHTHGGQIRLFGMTPVVPSKFGSRYAYGHIVEDNRHLVVSAGLGVSGIPLRFGSPPEIVIVELSSGGKA